MVISIYRPIDRQSVTYLTCLLHYLCSYAVIISLVDYYHFLLSLHLASKEPIDCHFFSFPFCFLFFLSYLPPRLFVCFLEVTIITV